MNKGKFKNVLSIIYDIVVMLVFVTSVCLIVAQYVQNKELRRVNDIMTRRVNSYEEFFLHKELSGDTKRILKKIRDNNRLSKE